MFKLAGKLRNALSYIVCWDDVNLTTVTFPCYKLPLLLPCYSDMLM
jgi:hypothetical protein